MMTLFAGLDGGASKTRLRVVDRDGAVVGEGKAGPGSLTVSVETAAANAKAALAEALAGTGHEASTCRLVCGLAGHRQPARRAAFEGLLGEVAAIEVVSDGYAALLGAHGGKPGGIVIAGTGSIGLRLDADGLVRQVGGWGPVVGDEGAGNWIGREVVRQALRAHDEHAVSGSPIAPLLQAVHAAIGGAHEKVLDWLAAANATRFAELAPLIVAHDREGDPLASGLLAEAAGEVGRLIRLASDHGRCAVSLFGGLAAILAPRLDQEVRGLLIEPAGDALDGALLRARGLAPPEVFVA